MAESGIFVLSAKRLSYPVRSLPFFLTFALTLFVVGVLFAQSTDGCVLADGYVSTDQSKVLSFQVRSYEPLTDDSTFGGPCRFVRFAPCNYWIRYRTLEIPALSVSVYACQLDKSAFARRGTELSQKLETIQSNARRPNLPSGDATLQESKTPVVSGSVASGSVASGSVASGSVALLFGYFESAEALERRALALKSEGNRVLLVRDLVEVALPVRNLAPRYEYRESIIRNLERARLCVSTVSTNFLSGPAYRFPEDKRPHLAVLVSDDHYHADKTWPLFAEYLERERGIYTTFLHGEMSGRYRGFNELDVCSALVVFQRREAIPDELAEKMRRLWSNPERGFLGMRTASHAFETRKPEPNGWTTISKPQMVEIIGGDYNNHGPNAVGSDIVNVEVNSIADGPRRELASRLLRQVQPTRWHSGGSQYFTQPLADDSVLLQNATQGDRTEPLTWVRLPSPERARIAFTCLGYPSDFNEPAGREMLTNLISWILRL